MTLRPRIISRLHETSVWINSAANKFQHKQQLKADASTFTKISIRMLAPFHALYLAFNVLAATGYALVAVPVTAIAYAVNTTASSWRATFNYLANYFNSFFSGNNPKAIPVVPQSKALPKLTDLELNQRMQMWLGPLDKLLAIKDDQALQSHVIPELQHILSEVEQTLAEDHTELSVNGQENFNILRSMQIRLTKRLNKLISEPNTVDDLAATEARARLKSISDLLFTKYAAKNSFAGQQVDPLENVPVKRRGKFCGIF